jgi:DNA-binding response OmpR family regulator
MYNGKKILFVDDDVDITTTYKIGLESHGFTVDIYNDPILALSNFKSGFYDLILIDIRMPDMTGFELSQKIRKKDSSVNICFITAFETYYQTLINTYNDMDFKCYIKKPITIESLVRRIEGELAIR